MLTRYTFLLFNLSLIYYIWKDPNTLQHLLFQKSLMAFRLQKKGNVSSFSPHHPPGQHLAALTILFAKPASPSLLLRQAATLWWPCSHPCEIPLSHPHGILLLFSYCKCWCYLIFIVHSFSLCRLPPIFISIRMGIKKPTKSPLPD